MGNLNADQLLQEILAKLLEGREGPGAVSSHDDALDGLQLGPVHEDRELRGGGLGACTHGLEGTQPSHITATQKEPQERLLGVGGGGMEVSV